MAEENKIDTGSQKLELFRALDQAEKDGNDRAKLEAYRQLQALYIADEKWYETAAVRGDAAVQGLWKGLSQTMGLPVDLTNLIVGLGETGVRKVLDAAGFEIDSEFKDSKLMSKKPFLGSAQTTEILNNLGIKTEYDKTRASTALIGRIAEEVGMSAPIAAPLAKGAAKPLDFLSKEAGIAVAAGTGAATAQSLFPGSAGAEITGQLVGGLSPIAISTILKYAGGKTGAAEAFNLIFRPESREKEIAGNILYQRLGAEKSAKLLEDIKEGKTIKLFGEEIESTKFPRTLDQITAEPELIILRQQLEGSEVGTKLVESIQETKLARLLELENNFLKNVKKKDYGMTREYGIESTVGAVESRVNHITNFLDKRLNLAKKTAADKIQAINPNMSRSEASALLRREIDDALQDALDIEQKMWSNVKGTINGDIISTGAAAIINNQFKTTPSKDIPEILYKLAGDKNLVEAGLLKTATKKQSIGPGLGTREVVVEPTSGILTNKEPVSEILNLRTVVRDQLRGENSKPNLSKEKVQSLEDLLGIIDESFMDAGSAKNLNDLTQAISYSDSLKANYYSGEIGKIIGYDTSGKYGVLPDTTFNKLIQTGETGGVTTRDVNKIIEQDSVGIQEGLRVRFANLADNDGNIPQNMRDKFVQNNEEALNEFPLLKQQFLDANESRNIVEQSLKNYKVAQRDVQKYRLETLASEGGQTLSAKGIVTSIFGAKDPVKDINNIIKLSARDETGAALKGLQNETTDFMLNQIKTKEITVGGKSQTVPDIKKLNNFIRTNEEALVALYGDDGFKTIQEFQSVLKDIDNAIIKGGMEDLEVIARNNVFVSSVGRILGTKVAAATGGPALVFAGIGGRVANALISKKSAKQIKALVGEAFTDADFAADLLRPYVADQQEVVSRAVNTFIVNAFGEQVREEVMPEIQQEPEEQSSSMNITDVRPVNQVSRLSNANIANPVGMMPTPTADTGPTGKVDSRTASMLFPDDKIFTPDTFAAQGGIMNARKPIQRVA
jgi:gas vesicle protein|tara:strand:+ start:1327 stop:4368 length:3042 start_codon:yes stop_codon:yes gene_type:complete